MDIEKLSFLLVRQRENLPTLWIQFSDIRMYIYIYIAANKQADLKFAEKFQFITYDSNVL